MLKIASWNVNSLRVRLPHVLEWLQKEKPTILALQETKITDDDFPALDINALDYHTIYSGQKTYNGVALISHSEATDVVTEFPGFPDTQRRVIGASFDNIYVLNVYVPNGSAVGTEKFEYKLDWLNQLLRFVEELSSHYERIIVLGDFNIAPTDDDVHDPVLWRGKVLCSAPEREKLTSLMELGFTDCFRLFKQEQNTYSWWDYRTSAFAGNRGLRIDLILASGQLQGRCTASYIDKNPRKLERPSDHAPVIAEFKL